MDSGGQALTGGQQQDVTGQMGQNVSNVASATLPGNLNMLGATMPNTGSAASPLSSHHSGGALNYLADLLGDTHDERVANAKALADAMEKGGRAVDAVANKTLALRLYRAQMKPMAIIGGGTGATHSPMVPPQLDSGTAEAIMSRLGYR
jgi:hypothetical protein